MPLSSRLPSWIRGPWLWLEGFGVAVLGWVGLAPRTERLVLVIVGIALAGLGWTAGLIGALVIIAALTIVTVVQRIRHVWNLTQASSNVESKEN